MEFTFLRVLKAHMILLITSLALITVGCEDDDHDDHNHEEEGHTDAEGFILEDEDAALVYKQFEGAIQGSITLAVGAEMELFVHFLDHDENEIEMEDHEDHEGEGDEDGLVVSVLDPNIATVEVEGHEEEEDHENEEHGMGIHISGVSAGETSFELKLMHQGHADFTSMPITITVTE